MSNTPPNDRDYLRGATHSDLHVNGLLAASETLASDVRHLTSYAATADPIVRNLYFKNAEPQVYLFPDVDSERFALASFPRYDSESDSMLFSLGRDLNLSPFPVSVEASFWNGFASVLVEQGQADRMELHYNLVKSLEDTNLAAKKISLGNTEATVRFGVLPFVLPLPRGLVLPDSLPFGQSYESVALASYPLLGTWTKAMTHLAAYNGHNSLHNGPLLKEDDMPPDSFFGGFNLAERMLSATTIRPQHEFYTEYSSYFTKHAITTFRDYGRYLTTRPGYDDDSDSPTMQTQPDAGGSPNSVVEIVKELIKNNGSKPSLSDQATLDEASDLAITWRIFGAAPGTNALVLPDLHPTMLHVLKAPSAAAAARHFRPLFEQYEAKEHNGSESMLGRMINFHASEFDGLFGTLVRTFRFSSQSLSADPDSASAKLSALAFLSPRNSAVRRDYVQHAEMQVLQETLGEDKSKREKKATALCLDGKVSTQQALIELAANVMAVYGCGYKTNTTEDSCFKQSHMATKIKEWFNVVSGREANLFFQRSASQPQVFLHFVENLNELLRGGYTIATNPIYRQAVKDKTPLDKTVFDTHFGAWATGLNDLRREVRMGVPSPTTLRIPTFAVHFSSLRLADEHVTKKQKTSTAGGQPTATAKSDHPTHKSDRAPDKDKVHISKEEQDKLKQRGFLKWTGTRMPSVRIPFSNDKGKHELLCWGFACQGAFCHFGNGCRRHHVAKYSDLPKDAQNQLAKEVTVTEGLTFAPGQGPPSKT